MKQWAVHCNFCLVTRKRCLRKKEEQKTSPEWIPDSFMVKLLTHSLTHLQSKTSFQEELSWGRRASSLNYILLAMIKAETSLETQEKQQEMSRERENPFTHICFLCQEISHPWTFQSLNFSPTSSSSLRAVRERKKEEETDKKKEEIRGGNVERESNCERLWYKESVSHPFLFCQKSRWHMYRTQDSRWQMFFPSFIHSQLFHSKRRRSFYNVKV